MREKLAALLRELESTDEGMMDESRRTLDRMDAYELIAGATAFGICADRIREILEAKE